MSNKCCTEATPGARLLRHPASYLRRAGPSGAMPETGVTAEAAARRAPRTDGSALGPAAVALPLALALFVLAPPAWAFRPVVSGDAAVADPKTLEIELGYFNLDRTNSENTFGVPGLVLTMGLVKRLEAGGEFRLEEGPTGGVEVVDPGISLKGVLREGVLQDREGPSIAVEAGLLLPSTVPGERGVGFQGVGIVSGRLGPVTLHLNAGGGVTRSETKPFATWGVVGELPAAQAVRVVGEVAGESVEGRRPVNSALLGVVWRPTATDLFLDAGVRRGISREAPDWEFTVGLTYAFSLSSVGVKSLLRKEP